MKAFIVAALALVAAADRPQPSYRPRPAYSAPTYATPTYTAQPSYKPIAILEEENIHPGDGSYNFHFSTENGIYRSESGVPLPGYGKNAYGQPEGSYRQEGSWSYTDGYGNPIKVTFVADDNGYQPSSDILPTPVPTQYPTPAVGPTYVEPQPAYVEPQPAYVEPQSSYGKPAYQPAYN
ncbi:endocuticle structural glycoprotein SgAbd-3-like [Amphibalanus amphitrite]|uniref:endocuticle structural glycoprotein SgAbd-3-like n=1 Tax=Amphibalanus amphitrite TaxID=1232801 RepID=UPI001C9234F5|nr:endocuticle structural glycoprotein SgAbd-3-like [Amphibalanus amphitrite]